MLLKTFWPLIFLSDVFTILIGGILLVYERDLEKKTSHISIDDDTTVHEYSFYHHASNNILGILLDRSWS